ncbi:unnamed protein product (macronuclear) [Paramecium tetraurelia]|uniref:Uncharacterized protein n=1 Tax=Paramecium tetraurelia TaxID=5888 RepID=A0CV52_PARTE|nr:uncharacterized protein GSPATT00010837001 [Paramecium tetraurelia]CAK74669.1 unnamed protein product [Paramecium tetraurelia]|eukprot:XP_001442066.1 hypothetical protein (macronuclear) [Paramecium tetraurelia strain d4-2]
MPNQLMVLIAFIEAFKLLRKQQYEKAIELIDRILLRSPNMAEAQYLKGLAHLGQNNLQQALYFCQMATQLDKQHSKALAEIGNIYILNKKYQEALNVFNKLVEMNEKSFEGYFGMAFVLTRLNNFEKAQCYYETALELKQNDKGVLLNYGHLKVKQQKYDQALELYQRALKQDPGYLEAIQSICNLFMIQKNYENLHEFCDQQLEQQIPQIQIAILNCKSQAYFSQKLFERSINLCNEVLTLDSKNLEGLFGIAMSLFNLNQLNQSLEYFQKIHTQYPKEIKSFKMIIKIQSTLQQYSQLREYCDQLLTIDPTDYSTYFFRGLAFMQQQNYQAALDDFNKVIVHDQSNFMAIKHKGFCLSMLKLYNQAIQCYDQIIKYILEPKQKSMLLFEKGFCHLKLRQNLSAKQNFEEAMEIDFNNQELKLKIANTSRDNKNYEYANKLYNQLITENGNIPLYYIEKAQMCEQTKDYVNAKSVYDELIALNNQNFEFYLKRSKIRIQLKQYTEAIQDLYQGLKLDNQQSELYFELGQLLYFQQDFKEAAEMLQKACTLNDNIEKYHIRYSIALQMQQADDEAIQHLKCVIKKHPDFEDCIDVLESLQQKSCYTKEYIQVFSYILASVLQEGILINNLSKEEIKEQLRNQMEKLLKATYPKNFNIFEMLFELMSNQENLMIIHNKDDLKQVLNNLNKNNFGSIEQCAEYIIEVSKRMASIWTSNSKKVSGLINKEFQREAMKLRLEYPFSKFQHKIVCAAIRDCLGLLFIIIVNSIWQRIQFQKYDREITCRWLFNEP